MLRAVIDVISAKRRLFAIILCAFFVANVLAPPTLLSVVRKPADLFMANPFLPSLPKYLGSDATIDDKVRFLPDLALFWVISSNEFGTEWGFTVTTTDLGRFFLTSFLFATYFSLWSVVRDWQRPSGRGLSGGSGVGGGFLSVLGFSTGPCSVVGCGAPVIPVVGLAFVGLSTGTLSLLAAVAKLATPLVVILMVVSILYLVRVVEKLPHESSPLKTLN